MILFLVIGGMALVVGAVVGGLGGLYRARMTFEPLLRDSEARAAASYAREMELRGQIASTQKEIESLREKGQEAEKGKIAAETQYLESEKKWVEQKALLDEAQAKLSDTFKALAADVLAGNTSHFLTLAQEKFKAIKEEAAVDLESRKTSVEALIRPLAETLAAYQKETKELEQRLLLEQGAVAEQLKASAMTQAALQSETTKLVCALKPHQVRGRWGEITLRRTVELAGMSPYCDFVEQENITTDHGRLRPDMIVKLPAGREIVIDSKVPLDGFLEAIEAKTEEGREAAWVKYMRQVNQQVVSLASKEYWAQFESSPEFVILFMPNDSFLSAAVERDPNLMESALRKRVVIATPVTLIGLLRAIAYGWRQEQVAENARAISELGQEFSDRIATMVEHFKKVGGAIGKAVESYNAAVTSFEHRVLPSARRFKTLGVSSKKEIEMLAPVDPMPRAVESLDEP